MTTRRKSSKLQLRRSISEQLRDSTSKAWDLLWRNIREKRLAEIEAKEACDWLRAAGFPQYAQLYEDSQFPIEISSVKRDHDFLDKDLVEPLCRRLNTLNKCASMKLDVSLPKKKSEDSDEEDLLAISNRWTFEWNSRRWSRLQDIDYLLGGAEERSPSEVGEDLRTTVSSESILTDLSEPEICSLHSEDSLAAMPDSASLTPLHLPRELPHYGSLPAKSRRRGRTRAKDFLRRMETLGRTWGPSMGRSERRSLVISSPVLQSEPEVLKTLRCVQILNAGPLNAENLPPANNCLNSLASSEASSQSETSGSAESTPNMKGRVSKLYPPGKRVGVYLEDIDVLAGAPQRRRPVEQSRKNEFCSYDELLVHIPKDHKPGTFPKALSIESLTAASKERGNWKLLDSEPQPFKCRKVGGREIRPVKRCCTRGSRISVYDNVPGSHLYASTGDLLDLEKEDIFPHLDDILQHVNGLQQIVDHWSKNVLPESEGEGDGGMGPNQRIVDGQSSSQITLDFEGTSVIEGLTTPNEGNKDEVSLNETDTSSTRERRDSGVGASLTRPRSVPKFMKRMKGPDYKDKMVFGVPLIVHVQRYGHPLPISLQLALRFLRSQCLDQVGLFRKSGVKSRIQALRQMCETSPENVNYEDQSAYDVADMVKQFFRDLPEPLLTSKMGETFLHIYQYVPKEQRLQAVQAAIMLMADENREVLQTLLCFLNDVTSSVEENQMTPMNLAVCLAPSLFHLNIMKNDNLSPRSIQRKYATGRPDQKDLNENLAATQGLAHMIAECNHLFEVGDGTPLRRWRVSVEVEAPPPVVLNRILRERHLWDSNLLQWKVLETLDKQTEVYQTWRTDMPKGVCALVSVSVDHEESPQLARVRGIILESQYLLEPCGSGKSRLTHICRADLKGKSPEWYNKAFGHLCASEAARIRNSFQSLDPDGPETKI
ncbi:hypothetical protein cypCar_00001911 [Cyprinus carpio]|nr:hypothetical protein cypCar_00001911 [Cyprinus carpio]